MSGSWFIRRGEEQWGPLTQAQFEELRDGGRIRDDDWVWCSHWDSWQRPRDLPLAGAFPPPPLPAAKNEVALESPEGVKRVTPREALTRLVGEHLRDLRIENKHRARYQYVELLDELLPDVERPDAKPWTESRLRDAVERASELITSFQWGCSRNDRRGEPPPDPPECYRVIWRHRDLARAFREGYASEEACPMDRESVAETAVEYLKQELRSPKFEVLLVDALVASEVYAFGEVLKENPSQYSRRFSFGQLARSMSEFQAYNEAKGDLDKLMWVWLKRSLKRAMIREALLFGIPIALAVYATTMNWEGLALAAMGFVAAAFGYRALSWLRRKARGLLRLPADEPLLKAFELHHRMVNAYEELKGGASSSPSRVREVLAKLADEGAVWDASVFAILDTAVARSPGTWR